MAELTVDSVRFPLRAPWRAAWGELSEREVLRVRIDFGDGDFGMGEAAPLEPYDGVSLASVIAALDAYEAVLARASPRRWPRSISHSGIAPAGGPGSRWRS